MSAAQRQGLPTPDMRSPRAGFSLIEVLVALGLTVLVVGAFSPFAAQLIASWGRGARTAEFADMLTTGVARLDRDFRGAVPMMITRGEETSMLFRGTASYVLFVATPGFAAGGEGLELISLSAEPRQGGGAALVRRRASLGSDPEAGGLANPVVLLDGRYEIAFSYVGGDGVRRPEWQNRPDMPVRVEITVGGAEGAAGLAAPLTFWVPADLPAACLTDDPPDACTAIDDAERENGQNGQPGQDPPGEPSK